MLIPKIDKPRFMMRTNKNTSKKAFRELGVTYCLITAMRHYMDSQLLCMNHRSAASYLVAIRGMEEVGKALLLEEGHDLKLPGGHEKRLEKFFISIPWFRSIDPKSRAAHYVSEANNARYVDIIDLENGEITWNHPVLKFDNEVTIGYLLNGIEYFINEVFSNSAIDNEYKKLNFICKKCYYPEAAYPRTPCEKGVPPLGVFLAGVDLTGQLQNKI